MMINDPTKRLNSTEFSSNLQVSDLCNSLFEDVQRAIPDSIVLGSRLKETDFPTKLQVASKLFGS